VEERFIQNVINNGRKKLVYINPISVCTVNEKHIFMKPVEVGGKS